MQAPVKPAGQQAPVKIYNAVYSSVQVYECMVRGIAVMRRRADSYVNATQILKVAGVDKGRRTKILEKEILPGKHEIVQGGYGKYQGTWIPLDRGRDIAIQFGVASLLSPLFDFVPNTNAIGALPPGLPPMSGISLFGIFSLLLRLNTRTGFPPGGLAPPPIMPGSALRLLNQGRAQGLFTPSTSSLPAPRPPDIRMLSSSRPPSTTPQDATENPSPLKRARTEPPLNTIQPKSPTSYALPPLPTSAPAHDTRRAAVIALIYQSDDAPSVINALRGIPPDNPALSFDPDVLLDDHGHTALHHAASMARHQIVRALIDCGADLQRGNYNAETPLIRATLATANYDTQTFHTLVAALHASIRTLDTARKSVLHHVAASAGVKGRAHAARYYLEQILYWIAQHQGGDFKSLVDLQDSYGDTALNIAARVGNRSLVRTLLDVGANRVLPNRLGLRPGDFGGLGGATRAEDILQSLRASQSAPVQKSQDVLADIQAVISELATDFSAEVKGKQEALDVMQAHLRAATRELSEQRKQIQVVQSQCAEFDLVAQRTRNLEKALEEEDKFDATGRTEPDGSDAEPVAGPAFRVRGPGSTIGSSVDLSINLDSEPPIPATDSAASLIRLRRLKMWHVRMEKLMEQRSSKLQGASAEKEFMCKKIVALCTGVPLDKVEDLLENLVIAVESEPQVIDIGRVSGFMQKVRNGVM
ncbi:hypothetical protein PHLGIDRAFT_103855 [Phlebiopsis gigantea 11061_1 CR5-6]|uniref:HTH APSES-type domain-containing protein n=1 Tax=Phlebiopsis gigantea (strain 11061_1 CR5-6) TaxID=745531 RepID=A0A0C3NU66_PHLG1|nr:hypothetical protein PHLGIDRAFT_103855 [Phlebiopsis gigantea 11061_1 CR5-6]